MNMNRLKYFVPEAEVLPVQACDPLAASGGNAGSGVLHDFDDVPGGSGGAGKIGVEDFG